MKIIFFILLANISLMGPALGAELRGFKLVSETQPQRDAFCFITALDLNGNHIKEIVTTDLGDCQTDGKNEETYHLLVLEWGKKGLELKWNKQWKYTQETDVGTWRIQRLLAWPIKNQSGIETMPPYLTLRWDKDRYVLHERDWGSGRRFDDDPVDKNPVGSELFPWLSTSCYARHPKQVILPRECLLGVRDFFNNGQPRIVTLREEENPSKRQDITQTLRVRRLEPDFPIEWEMVSTERLAEIPHDASDPLNVKATGDLLLWGYRLLGPIDQGPKYQLKSTQVSPHERMGLATSQFSGHPWLTRVGSTQQKCRAEYWGFREEEAKKPREEALPLLRKVTFKPDLTGLVREDISFPHHERFLGVGFFDIQDIDGDGLDELLLVEQTGRAEFGEDGIYYHEVKDYIRILKWTGKDYRTLWVSPPYTTRGTRFLVEDIKNTGKKQLVVATGDGKLQVWERE